MTNFKLMDKPGALASDGSAILASTLDLPIRSSMIKKRTLTLILLAIAIILNAALEFGNAQTINCPSGFNTTTTTSGACGISVNGGGADFWIANHPATILSGSAAIVAPPDAGHQGNSLIRQKKVNNQAFTATFTFVPNALNLAFVIENQTNQSGQVMTGGAGGEGGFSQFAGGTNIAPNNVFALMFDQDGPLTDTGVFSYSDVQIYQSLQAPYIPLQDQAGYLPQYVTNKISTFPVSLNSPWDTLFTTTGDTYSATVVYDGYTLTLNLFDITAGGACPGLTCFVHSWKGVYIPEITGATTSYVGFTAGTSGAGGGTPYPLNVKSFKYTVNTPTGTPSFTAWNANSTYNSGTTSAASPVYSVAPGTYLSPQTVAISTSRSPYNYICYVLSATPPSLYPQPDNNGGCSAGTLYTGPISISGNATLYAMAGSDNSSFPLGSTNPAGLGPPSTLVAGTYTITGGSTTATPTFSPVGGSYTAAQSVSLADASSSAAIYYTTDGTTPTVSSSRYVSPMTLDSSTTLKAVAVAAGSGDSPVASADYTISPESTVSTPTFAPAAGTFTSGQSISIADKTSGATIYFTTDGSTPTTSSKKYAGPVSVDSTETLKAIAVAANDINSSIASGTYSIVPVINFASGFNGSPTTIEPIGGAYYSGSTIQLTSLKESLASNAYFTAPVNIEAFNTTFTWTVKCPSASTKIGCGDGMGFVIINAVNPNSPNFWSGGYGSDLSWANECTVTGCEPIKSVLVKFDLYDNAKSLPGANLTGYYRSGQYPQAPNPQYDMGPSGINIEAGHLMRANLAYDGTTLTETVTDTVTHATYTNHYTTNIPAVVGGNTAIVGFAGATGGAQVQQNINSWTYTVE